MHKERCLSWLFNPNFNSIISVHLHDQYDKQTETKEEENVSFGYFFLILQSAIQTDIVRWENAETTMREPPDFFEVMYGFFLVYGQFMLLVYIPVWVTSVSFFQTQKKEQC